MIAAVVLRLALLSVLYENVLGSKILAIMLVPSKSHNLWNSKYLEALARRGHDITYVTLQKMRERPPNVRQIVFDKVFDEIHSEDNMTEYSNFGPMETALKLDEWDMFTSEMVRKSETFHEFMETIKTESFDLVVHDVAICNFMLGAVGVLKNPPVVGITPFGRPSWILNVLKNPVLHSSHPHSFVSYPEEMSFFQRVFNFLFYIFAWLTRSVHMAKQNKLAREAFGNNTAPLEEVMDRMNVIMVNSNDGFDFPYARVPGLIPVGGLHIDPPKPLPKDLQEYLDGAKHGLIYFSLGTNTLASNLRKDKIEMLMEAFRELAPIRFLWKWDGEDLPGLPRNIKLMKWVQQSDVLAHPNVVLFFSHSGLLSTQEAIYHGVPILGMPFLLDQFANLKKCVQRGIAEEVHYTTLTKELVVEKIKKILSTPKYKENIRKLSELFRDSMERPRDRAVFWTEYAIRHKGAEHLSPHARKMTWYQNAQLDIYLFLLLTTTCTLSIVYKLLWLLCRRFVKKETKLKKT